jgi:hypothetical protein
VAAVGRDDGRRGGDGLAGAVREQRRRPHRFEHARDSVPAAHDDARLELSENVRVASGGVEGEMARTCAGPQRSLPVQRQLALPRVEGEDAHLVRAEVDSEHPSSRGIGQHLVCMRTRLAGTIRSAALAVPYVARGPRAAVGAEGQHGDTAGAVVGRQQVFAHHREMGGCLPPHGHGDADRAGLRTGDVIGGDRPSCRLGDGVQDRSRPSVIDSQVGRVRQGIDDADFGQRSRCRFHGGHHDAAAARRRERSDEGPIRALVTHSVLHRCARSPTLTGPRLRRRGLCSDRRVTRVRPHRGHPAEPARTPPSPDRGHRPVESRAGSDLATVAGVKG